MNNKDIVECMIQGIHKAVVITDVKDATVKGIIKTYESRFDNSDDGPDNGEASIILDGDDGNSYLLFESDIKKIELK